MMGRSMLGRKRPTTARRPLALLAATGAALQLSIGLGSAFRRRSAPASEAFVPDVIAGTDFYQAVFYPLLALTMCLAWITRPKLGNNNGDIPDGFAGFQTKYLLIWALAVGADWLQGPYVYALYESYGYTQQEIARLFVAGFGSSMVFGTFVGCVADAWGRKRCAILYCALYIASCSTKHFNNYGTLMVGRITGGIATSLLFSTFECWMVAEHNKHNFGEGLLQYMFGLMFFVQYLMAIISGLVAEFGANFMPLTAVEGHDSVFYGGYITPFDMSSFLLVIATPLICTLWDENYGDKDAGQKLLSSIATAGRAVISSKEVCLVGLVVAAFEGSMYAFVFNWTPALKAMGGPEPPYGKIFSEFLMACMCGSSAFGLLQSTLSPTKTVFGVCAIATVSFGAVAALVGTEAARLPMFLGFLGFEACVGLYFPAIGMLKSGVVPEEARAGVYNIYRVPLNAIVLLLLLTGLPLRSAFGVCGVLLAVATAAVTMLPSKKE